MTVDQGRIRPRVETFDRLQYGDEVKLTGEQGCFKFLSAALDGDGVVLWLDLHGGTANREKMRSVVPGRVKIPSERALKRQRAMRASR